MIVGFCTPCMNRRWQMEQTLAHNLQVLRGTGHFLALCDYNSIDGLPELVRSFADDIGTGKFLYFRTDEPDTFHASLAKNTAHRLALRARPDVLFNLDADNFVTKETIQLVESLFGRGLDNCLHNWSTRWGDGSAGRIAMSAASWTRLGGYDETFLPMAWQDMDLLMRARAIGLAYHLSPVIIKKSVTNTHRQKLAHVATAELSSELGAQQKLQEYNIHNFVNSLARPVSWDIATHRKYRGQINFSEEVTI